MPVEEVKTIYATTLDVRKAYNVVSKNCFAPLAALSLDLRETSLTLLFSDQIVAVCIVGTSEKVQRNRLSCGWTK